MNSLKIIAEVAQGYEGKPELAEMLVKGAAAAGADAIKFQLVYADELAAPDYKHFKLFQSLEMQDSIWEKLSNLAHEKKISLFFDIYGPRSLKVAERLQIPAVKIHSTDMQNPNLLKMVSDSSIPLIFLSVSGCLEGEIHQAVEIMGDKKIILLHGFQTYPTPIEANQISRISALKSIFKNRSNIDYGFADHVPVEDNLRFTLAAVSIGLEIGYLEKHLTLSKIMKLEDHESALSPDEFACFVRNMKECSLALGKTPHMQGIRMHPSELDYRTMTHKHVIANQSLESGTVLKPEHLNLKRTSSSNPIYDLKTVYGKKLVCRVEPETAITLDLLED